MVSLMATKAKVTGKVTRLRFVDGEQWSMSIKAGMNSFTRLHLQTGSEIELLSFSFHEKSLFHTPAS